MCFTKPLGWPSFGRAYSLIERGFLYLLVTVVPLAYYRWIIDGFTMDIRKTREVALYSFGIIVCSFLQKNKWLRLFIIWCVVNWWLNIFVPRESYIGLTNIFSALALYVGFKHLLKGFLKVDVVLRIICLTAVFQFAWMVMQGVFNYDPIFYRISHIGAAVDPVSYPLPLVGWSGNPALLGTFFAITSFLLLHYFRIKNVPVLFFLILSSLFFLRSATAIMCFAGAGMFYVFNRYQFRRKWLIILLIVVSTVALFSFVKMPNNDRLPIWEKVLKDGVKIRPYVGSGINFFGHFYIIDKTNTPWREVHNDYIQMVLELGLIGFILFSGWIISKFVMFYGVLRTHKEVCIASCLVAYLLAGLSLFPMHLAQMSFYAIVLLSCLEARGKEPCLKLEI